MEIKIILDSEELKTAVRDFLLNKYGITQEFVGEIKYLDSGLTITKGIICDGISEIKKPFQATF